MPDCFSLPNAAELVEHLRYCALPGDCGESQKCPFVNEKGMKCIDAMITKAADAIEALLAENAKLKAELDAAILDIEIRCGTCKNQGIYCLTCHTGCDRWEWRGVKEEEDGKVH